MSHAPGGPAEGSPTEKIKKLFDLSEDEITNILSWMQETQSNLEIRREKFFSIELPESMATIVHSFFLVISDIQKAI